MSRRESAKKRLLSPDPVYNSQLIHIIVNQLMKRGKKSVAYKLFYDSMNQIKNKTQKDPLKTVEQAIRNATPMLEVKSRRVAGSTQQVPRDVSERRGTALAVRWILSSCRSKSGINMVSKLSTQFLEASRNTGNAVRKKNEMQKMADANKVFARPKY
uniref:Small ribosomal subunit protein uS7c n=1 Tax=Stichococcus bacillaris TaxID=37433 RepID=A0A097KKH9_9CHLO|nr:ribosomal protein S7 [Stichococcus bacillaris]AIT93700.1 ribosomal protein S7 [Stichococcus bacillaris]|mmetsp:Transcript_4967/g.14308  ORF Transcript_4967/g.14308 Transcript_4967/m.14308 type:complete len:157 (+) Transcript_4967:552-1022(+)